MTKMIGYLNLTQANLDNSHMYLAPCMGVFPSDSVGGANKSHAAVRTVRVNYGSGHVDTDIDGEKQIFRERKWVRQFFDKNRLKAGDWVMLEQLQPYSYRVYRVEKLGCLSIQQPWADLIFEGKKKVENRSRRFWAHRQWKLEGSMPLAIHASKRITTWRDYDEQKQQELAPGWKPGDSDDRIGVVLGVVDLVEICGYKDLPSRLKGHKFADREVNNWCWVLDDPRTFSEPFSTTGNVFFQVPTVKLSSRQIA